MILSCDLGQRLRTQAIGERAGDVLFESRMRKQIAHLSPNPRISCAAT